MRPLTVLCVLFAITSAACGADQSSAGTPAAANFVSSPATAVPAAGTPAPVADPAPAVVSPSAANDVDRKTATSYREITIPSGTRLSVRMGSTVSSRTSGVEEAVQGTVQRAIVIDGVSAIPAGATLTGYVTESARSGRVKGRARVGFRFTGVNVGGSRYDIGTATVAREARGTKKRDAIGIGVGTGAGALIGGLTGGKKGAAIGGAVGAAGGTGVVLATRGAEVNVPAGTVVTTRLTKPLTVRIPIP